MTRIQRLTEKQKRALTLMVEQRRVASSTIDRNRLVAYVVPEPDSHVNRDELRAWLQSQVPDYMVPASVEVLDVLPRNSNGKLDIGRLPETDSNDTSSTDEITPPRNDVERLLADIWSDLLGLEMVSVHDDFFEVGGDSILSIQVLSRARQAGLLLEPAHMADGATIAELAAVGTEIAQLDAVLRERGREPDPEQSPRFIFRLDGLGNTIQYYEVTAARQITLSKTLRFDQAYTRETRLEEIATDYLQAIRQIQPAGPYMFVSMDCGAHVTFETAQQLLRMDEDVSFFAVVEAAPPLLARSVASKYVNKAFRYLRQGNLRGLVHGIRLTAQRRLRFRKPAETTDDANGFNHGLTINNYLPRRYPGRITVFQSTAFHEQAGPENIRLWKALAAGGFDVEILRGGIPLDVFDDEHAADFLRKLPAAADASGE